MNNTGYSRFLQEQWPQQQPLVARYMLAGEQVWLKRAGPRHGMWRYRLLGAAAGVLRVGRTPLAGIVATVGPFDLDDLGAEVGQDHAAGRPHHHVGELEDADAGERQGVVGVHGGAV